MWPIDPQKYHAFPLLMLVAVTGLQCADPGGSADSFAGSAHGEETDTLRVSVQDAWERAGEARTDVAERRESLGEDAGGQDDGQEGIADSDDRGGIGPAVPGAIFLEAEPQRAGDPEAGYYALVHEGYVGCGLPLSVYQMFFSAAPPEQQLPGREGLNETLPYYFNAFTTPEGIDVVTPNCLTCHGSVRDGQVIVGLGDTTNDYTVDTGAVASAAEGFISDPGELDAWSNWSDHVKTLSPYIKPLTVGVNPADNIAAVLFSHRDPETLEWSDEPLLPPPPKYVVPVDVPPWWRMKKKHAMFYTAAGRGDHARIMMTASTLCVGSVEKAEAIDAYFPDVRAYLASLEPPPYPGEIDEELASVGQGVFEKNCAGCHGTYGPDGVYPNLLIPNEVIGTDDTLSLGASQFAQIYVDWFNSSFYGEIARLEPQQGYVAPPLDGIWVTAPFLHNGSVPTVAVLLESEMRPTYWTRSFDPDDFDSEALGVPYTELDDGHDTYSGELETKLIYDTTKLGYGNGGHLFGDGLPAGDRVAVIEYLKTL